MGVSMSEAKEVPSEYGQDRSGEAKEVPSEYGQDRSGRFRLT